MGSVETLEPLLHSSPPFSVDDQLVELLREFREAERALADSGMRLAHFRATHRRALRIFMSAGVVEIAGPNPGDAELRQLESIYRAASQRRQDCLARWAALKTTVHGG